jgi:hypothetical protein
MVVVQRPHQGGDSWPPLTAVVVVVTATKVVAVRIADAVAIGETAMAEPAFLVYEPFRLYPDHHQHHHQHHYH